ncbi:hypothetical protein GCM10009714_15000 [Microlunatus capsulatus]
MGTLIFLLVVLAVGYALYSYVRGRSGVGPGRADDHKRLTGTSTSVPSQSNGPEINPDHWIGRKFRTELSLDESLRAFESVKDECYDITSRESLVWSIPEGAANFQSTQGSPAILPPARLVSYVLARGGRITLALWDGMISNGGNGVDGSLREMWFVPSEFDRSAIMPIAGRWKAMDPSLASIGWVESPLWGARSDPPAGG